MKRTLTIAVVLLLILSACNHYTPKPRGYFRIDFAKPHYTMISLSDLPYSFKVSQLATIELPPVDSSANWLNIVYPTLHAKVYCSYLNVKGVAFTKATDECRALVSKEAKKIDEVAEQSYVNDRAQVYGTIFLLDNESASPIQFMLTDSSQRLFRGALYYECPLNSDSLAPVTNYLRDNIRAMIESFKWK